MVSKNKDGRLWREYITLPLSAGSSILKLISSHIHYQIFMCKNQGWSQVQLTKYSSTPITPNIYQVQVLVKYSFFKKVLKYIKYFHIKYKFKYSY